MKNSIENFEDYNPLTFLKFLSDGYSEPFFHFSQEAFFLKTFFLLKM